MLMLHFVQGLYIVAGVLFILSLAGLAKQTTARMGNIAGMIGMVLALVATIIHSVNMSATQPDPNRPVFWNYAGAKVTQYWRKPPDTFDESLRATVNARRVYWASKWPIPGGVSFENFELSERFVQGQTSVFGITSRSPDELVGEGQETEDPRQENGRG